MTKTESIIVGLFLAVVCPLLIFVLFWWTAALLHLHFPGVPLYAVIMAAGAGLALGLILDILFLKGWVRTFYTASVWFLAAVYLALSVAAVAFFMGLPVGTFLLGIGVGVYTGRRQHHAHADGGVVSVVLRRAAFLAALVTTATALPIGILALDEESVIRLLENVTGFEAAAVRGSVGLAIVGLLCLSLFVLQYWSSKQAGRLASRIGRADAQSLAPADADKPRR